MTQKRTPVPETKARSEPSRTVTDGPFAETKELIFGSCWREGSWLAPSTSPTPVSSGD